MIIIPQIKIIKQINLTIEKKNKKPKKVKSFSITFFFSPPPPHAHLIVLYIYIFPSLLQCSLPSSLQLYVWKKILLCAPQSIVGIPQWASTFQPRFTLSSLFIFIPLFYSQHFSFSYLQLALVNVTV